MFASRKLFASMCLFIVSVSVYDGYLVARFADVMPDAEQNPVGRWLMEQDDGNVELFLRAKTLGTSLVLGVLAGLYALSTRLAMPVATSVAMFQMLLLGYLTFM